MHGPRAGQPMCPGRKLILSWMAAFDGEPPGSLPFHIYLTSSLIPVLWSSRESAPVCTEVYRLYQSDGASSPNLPALLSRPRPRVCPDRSG